MNAKHSLSSIVILLTLSFTAQASSFNCAKAITPQEKAICADSALSRADDKLAAAYKTALSKVSSQGQVNLRADQSSWLQWLATVCRASKPQPAADLAKCMNDPYRDRTEALDKIILRKDPVLFYRRTLYLAHQDDPMPPDVPAGTFNGIGYLIVDWPQADNSSPPWTAWNNAVHTAVQRFASFGQKDTLTSKDAADADTDVTSTITAITASGISTTFSLETMGHGAAHPNEAASAFHWLLEQKHAMLPTDVFRPDSAWKPFLARQCWAGLKKQFPNNDPALFIKGPSDKSLVQVVGDIGNWSITKDGLEIDFPEYSVTPRVAPADPVVIPWSALKTYLVPNFDPKTA